MTIDDKKILVTNVMITFSTMLNMMHCHLETFVVCIHNDTKEQECCKTISTETGLEDLHKILKEYYNKEELPCPHHHK